MTRDCIEATGPGSGLCAVTMQFLARAQGAQVFETPLLSSSPSEVRRRYQNSVGSMPGASYGTNVA